VKRVSADSSCCYGYRRIHAVTRSAGVVISEKVIGRIMQEEQLAVLNESKKPSAPQARSTPRLTNTSRGLISHGCLSESLPTVRAFQCAEQSFSLAQSPAFCFDLISYLISKNGVHSHIEEQLAYVFPLQHTIIGYCS
jgi:hypothetical protein